MELALPVTAPARTYGKLRLTSKGWEISALEPHVAIRLKQIFPRVPKASSGPYFLPANSVTGADLRWFTERYPLDISPDDAAALAGANMDYLRAQADMERIMLPDYVPPSYTGLRPGYALRHYQAQAVQMAALSRGLLLGDECGLGKTWVGTGLALDPERLPAVVVCQLHIQRQWVDHLRKTTSLRVHGVKMASPYDLPPADVYVFRYTQLAGWVHIFEKGIASTVIYDEPQELRTGMKSSKGVGANTLSNHAAWKLGLTATPIYNYGQEIYNIMRFINAEIFGDWSDFCREYLNENGKLKDPKALGAYLRDQRAFLRRTKADVGKELAPVNRIIDVVDYDEDVVEEVEKLARQLAIKATTGSFVERGSAARELDLRVRQATGISKAKAIAAYVRVLVEAGEPVLLMGWHRAVYDIWLTEMKDLNPVLYTGSESGAQKNASKEAFLRGEAKVLIMSLRSAAGLDGLQHVCSTIVFGELDWSPGVHHQCIERLDRDGQTKPVMALFLVTEDGSDPPMMQVLGLKASEAHQVVDPNLGVTAAHSDESHLQRLVERYLDKSARLVHSAPAPALPPPPAPAPAQAEMAI